MNNERIEPEFFDDELEQGAHNVLARVIAGIAGISIAAASGLIAKKIYEAKQEAKDIQKEEYNG